MSHYRITVLQNGETIQAYPGQRERDDTRFEDVCKRIGMMVMAAGITQLTVYRDGEVYRQCEIQKKQDEVAQ